MNIRGTPAGLAPAGAFLASDLANREVEVASLRSTVAGVLPAHSGERSRVHTNCLARLLVRFVDTGDTFKGFLINVIHPVPQRRRQVLMPATDGVMPVLPQCETSFLQKGWREAAVVGLFGFLTLNFQPFDESQ